MTRSAWLSALLMGLVLGVVLQFASSDAAGPRLGEVHRLRDALVWQKHERRRLHGELRERWRLARPTLVEAARIEEIVYGVSAAAILRVSACETSGSFDAHARANAAQNPSGATGPLQFMPDTWAATPFAAWPATDAYASVLAAGWKVRREGGWDAWACGWAAE